MTYTANHLRQTTKNVLNDHEYETDPHHTASTWTIASICQAIADDLEALARHLQPPKHEAVN